MSVNRLYTAQTVQAYRAQSLHRALRYRTGDGQPRHRRRHHSTAPPVHHSTDLITYQQLGRAISHASNNTSNSTYTTYTTYT